VISTNLDMAIANKSPTSKMTPLSILDFQESPAANTRGAKLRRRLILFSRLPNEILEDVFLEDILSRKDLCKLALISRRFSKLIQVPMYNGVSINWSNKTYGCFKRTLSDCPRLGSCVWRLDLMADDEADYDAFNQENRQLLKTMPALRSRDLPARFSRGYELRSLIDNKMACLRSLAFGDDGESGSIGFVTKLFSLPQIKRLQITYNHQFAYTSFRKKLWLAECKACLGRSEDAPVGSSSVKELVLELWPDSDILNSGFLSFPRALEKLEFRFKDSQKLTPKEIVDALRPLYSTLVFLDLNCVSFRADVSGPVADFSRFVFLKTLIIDDGLCLER
jgi:hypothetical protein